MAQGRDSGFQYDLAGHYSSSMEIFVFGNIFKQKRRLLARIAGVGSWVNNSSDLKPLVNNFFKALVMGDSTSDVNQAYKNCFPVIPPGVLGSIHAFF